MGPRSNWNDALASLAFHPPGARSPSEEDIVHHRPSFKAALLAGAAALALPSAGCSPARPQSAEGVVKKMSDRLASAQSFSFTTQEKHQRRRSGAVVEIARSRTFTVKRPDAIAFKTVGGEMGGGLGVYDGKSFTMVWPDQKAYARVKMPATIDAALDRVAEHFNIPLPVGDLLYASAYDALVSPDTTGRYVGREKLGAIECDHVAFTQERVDWELWVAVAGDPTPCRLTITSKGKSGALTSDVTFSDWNLAAAAPANAFEVNVPQDYERIPVASYEPAQATPASAPAAAASSAPPAKP